MTARGLWRSVRDDLTRHWGQIAAGALGIAVSIAALVFFLALGLGVREVLLGDIFPVDRIEVVPRSTDLNLLAIKLELGKDTIDDEMVAKLEAIDGVAAVYPEDAAAGPGARERRREPDRDRDADRARRRRHRSRAGGRRCRRGLPRSPGRPGGDRARLR